MVESRMYVAACGICCSVCGLYKKGVCLPCGSGLQKDKEVVRRKMEEQMKNLGHVCSKLHCVVDRKIGFCTCDCSEFPCESYSERRFPYSEGFLKMYISRSRSR